MAQIKCRFSMPFCELGLQTIQHDEYWFCDEPGDYPFCEYKRPLDAGNCVNPTCDHLKYLSGEFEKTVKRYEYTENGDLRTCRRVYYAHDIEYLEIDGMVLVEPEDRRE